MDIFQHNKTSEPLYIDAVKHYFDNLEPEDSSDIALLLTVDSKGSYRHLRFKVPTGRFSKSNCINIFERYILARINNFLVTFGGTCLTIYFERTDDVIKDAIQKAIRRYDVSNEKNIRRGLGCITNYISRMNVLLGTCSFSVECKDIKDFELPNGKLEFRISDVKKSESEEHLLLRSAVELEGKVFCGLDIGGNSIKAAVVADGEIKLVKTYSWFPTLLTTAEELINPIIIIIRFMNAVMKFTEEKGTSIIPNLDEVMQSTTEYEELLDFTKRLESKIDYNKRIFDGIVIGFPDIVVHDKIAGGESYKQRGMRNNPNTDYEEEFKKQRDLNLLAEKYIKDDGVVKVLNDGNVSSFVFSVEQQFVKNNIIDQDGMLAYTIGTEMGTGFISREGSIQWIPLECYNYIIDLGSEDYYQYDVNDVRSVNNFSSHASGTVQKYISQIGLIRIAVKHIKEDNPALFQQLMDDGYLHWDIEKDELIVSNKPKDMRSPLTRKLVELLKIGNAELIKTYEEIGCCLGVVIKEVSLILNELSTTKLISGGIVVVDECFKTVEKGLHKSYPDYEIKRLDTTIIHSPLLKKLDKDECNYATAVGSAYIANRELILKNN
jgi:hypothetical protein